MSGVYDSCLRVVSANKNYDFTIVDEVNYSRPFLNVCRDVPIDIGIDQSTSQIGFAARNADTHELLCMMDIVNMGFPDKESFKSAFARFLKLNLAGINVRTFIYEIPVEHGGNMYVRRILDDLLMFMSRLPGLVPELQKAEMLQVNNLTWKTHYLADPCYKGLRKRTEDVKRAAMAETLKRYSWARMPCEYFPGPPDSCDAVGILYGSFEEMTSSFSPQYRRVNKLMPAKPRIKYDYRVVACPISHIRDFAIKEFKLGNEPLRLMEYNPDMSMDENCRRFVSNYKGTGVLTVTSSKAQSVLKWETMVSCDKPDDVLFILIRKGA